MRSASLLVFFERILSRAEMTHRDAMNTIYRREDEANLLSILQESAPQSSEIASRGATELTIYHSAATNVRSSTKSKYRGHFGPVERFWQSHVSLRVPHVKCRDHLGGFI